MSVFLRTLPLTAWSSNRDTLYFTCWWRAGMARRDTYLGCWLLKVWDGCRRIMHRFKPFFTLLHLATWLSSPNDMAYPKLQNPCETLTLVTRDCRSCSGWNGAMLFVWGKRKEEKCNLVIHPLLITGAHFAVGFTCCNIPASCCFLPDVPSLNSPVLLCSSSISQWGTYNITKIILLQ